MNRASLFRRAVEFEIVPLTARDCTDAALLHGESFRRPWSDGELRALNDQEPVFGYIACSAGDRRTRQFGGFVLARLVADEAEILTIAVRPRHRQSGLGWRLMVAVLNHLRAEGAASLFLEVDETNDAAVALYRRLGFEHVAERSAYYDQGGGARSAALVMRLNLG